MRSRFPCLNPQLASAASLESRLRHLRESLVRVDATLRLFDFCTSLARRRLCCVDRNCSCILAKPRLRGSDGFINAGRWLLLTRQEERMSIHHEVFSIGIEEEYL